MKYSSNWLQEHIVEPLPKAEELARTITIKSFEVEGVESYGADTVFDIKVLPDRAHDALSHRGMAREIAALFGLTRKERERKTHEADKDVANVRVEVTEKELCLRYLGVRVDDVKIGPSPEWLQTKLSSIGQRSINNIVDLTNFILFDLGQPMHAFDAAKVAGGITVRLAKAGEQMTTLDGKALTFDGTELVIADDEGVLALAGVKGGKKAEVDEHTTSIIFECANFDPTSMRKTSTKHNIKTDASKRYENGMTSELAGEAITLALMELQKILPVVRVGQLTDVYAKLERQYKVGVAVSEINRLLGFSLDDAAVAKVLHQAALPFELVNPHKQIALSAESVIDKPYHMGASVLYDAPERFDCSSLTAWLYSEAGYGIPRMSVDQFVFARPISREELLPGDLVFTNSPVVEGGRNVVHYHSYEWMPNTPVVHGIDHVGVYVGDGMIIHATKHGMRVQKELLAQSERFDGSCWYGRIIESDESRFVVIVPFERLDLRIKEDLIEEIGRHYGYDKIEPTLPKLAKKGLPNKRLYYANKVRNFLATRGFSEVYTYSFATKGEGDIEVMNPVGKDRPFMRQSLAPGVERALTANFYNAPFLEIPDVKIFEFGNVFGVTGEHLSLALGAMGGTKKRWKALEGEFQGVMEELLHVLNVHTHEQLMTRGEQSGVIDVDFDTLIAPLPEPSDVGELPLLREDIIYRSLSPYPFIVRDVALWVPVETIAEEVETIIRSNAGELAQKIYLFDTFEKDGKQSFAFRMVLQSFDRTLDDAEANAVYDNVVKALEAKNSSWHARV